jgi:hypothetical protein
MIFALVLLIIAAVSLVVYALFRGLHAFLGVNRTTDDTGFDTQNKMMFARVKWQAIVIVMIVILMALASRG